jgi:hypothetical protein
MLHIQILSDDCLTGRSGASLFFPVIHQLPQTDPHFLLNGLGIVLQQSPTQVGNRQFRGRRFFVRLAASAQKDGEYGQQGYPLKNCCKLNFRMDPEKQPSDLTLGLREFQCFLLPAPSGEAYL